MQKHISTARALAAVAVVGLAAVAIAARSRLLRRMRRTAPAAISAEIERVLGFWFDGEVDVLHESRWFVPDGTTAQQALDGEVRENFGALLRRAELGDLSGWADSARGLLALIVLLDQLS